MANMTVKLSPQGESLLVSRYCELYWEMNEMQIIGTPAARAYAKEIACTLEGIVDALGYVPVP